MNTLRQFWSPGHSHCSKTKKISRGSRSGECTNQIFCHGLFLHVYSSHFLTKMKINSFKFKFFFFLEISSLTKLEIWGVTFSSNLQSDFLSPLYIGQKWKLILLNLFFILENSSLYKTRDLGYHVFFKVFFFFFFNFFCLIIGIGNEKHCKTDTKQWIKCWRYKWKTVWRSITSENIGLCSSNQRRKKIKRFFTLAK